MAKRAEPWYWTARKCWYIQVDKKQIKLDPDEAEARRLWHRMMAETGKLTRGERDDAMLPDVMDLFIQSREARRSETLAKYIKFLQPFAVKHQKKKISDLRYSDVFAYCNGPATWSDGTKHGAFGMIVTVFKWARDSGFLELNPLAGHPNPFPKGFRERGMLVSEYDTLIKAINDPEMRLLLRVMRSTGCRPGEAYKFTARHIHPTLPVVTLAPHEHKTGSRTGRSRYVIFPAGLMKEIRELALANPDGPVLRNTRGRPWNTFNVSRRFSLYRERLGLPREVVPYATRHAFATGALDAGHSPEYVAKMMGHVGTATLQSVYFHPAMEKMMGIADTESLDNRPVEIPPPPDVTPPSGI